MAAQGAPGAPDPAAAAARAQVDALLKYGVRLKFNVAFSAVAPGVEPVAKEVPFSLTDTADAETRAVGQALMAQLLTDAELTANLALLLTDVKAVCKKRAEREAEKLERTLKTEETNFSKLQKDVERLQAALQRSNERLSKLRAETQQNRERGDLSPTRSVLAGLAGAAGGGSDDEEAETRHAAQKIQRTKRRTFTLPEVGHKPDSKCGIIFDARLAFWHDPKSGRREDQPHRIERIYKQLCDTGALAACRHLIPISADSIQGGMLLSQVHDAAYLERIGLEAWRALQGDARNDMFADDNTRTAAYLAAGCCVEAVKSVMTGEVQTAFALVRPPGHHAHRAYPEGFCWINNVAVAARAALQNGAKKVAVIDWDVHHGNGTQDIFWDSKEVLYMSLHRYKISEDRPGFFYPGTGSAEEVGSHAAAGFTVNVPFAEVGMTDVDYMAAFDHIILPILKEFKPDVILISAGFDPPEYEMNVTTRLYAAMTKALMQVRGAAAKGGPRVMSCLEGGYEFTGPHSTAICADTMVRAQLYAVGGTCEPAGEPDYTVAGTAALSTPQVLKAVRDAHRKYWGAINASEAAFNTWCADVAAQRAAP